MPSNNSYYFCIVNIARDIILYRDMYREALYVAKKKDFANRNEIFLRERAMRRHITVV